jgi:hypothetical protein
MSGQLAIPYSNPPEANVFCRGCVEPLGLKQRIIPSLAPAGEGRGRGEGFGEQARRSPSGCPMQRATRTASGGHNGFLVTE